MMKRLKMESSMIQVEVCHLVTRNGSKKCYHILSEQHSELNTVLGFLCFSKEKSSRRVSFLDQRIPSQKYCLCLALIYVAAAGK